MRENMDTDKLAAMDAQADNLVTTWASHSFSGNGDIRDCTIKMGNRFNTIYETSPLPLDLISEYGSHAAGWVIDHTAEVAYEAALLYVGKALIKVYHDHATGKKTPKPKVFLDEIKIILHGHTHSPITASPTLAHGDKSSETGMFKIDKP
jgi:hypothetical protein